MKFIVYAILMNAALTPLWCSQINKLDLLFYVNGLAARWPYFTRLHFLHHLLSLDN